MCIGIPPPVGVMWRERSQGVAWELGCGHRSMSVRVYARCLDVYPCRALPSPATKLSQRSFRHRGTRRRSGGGQEEGAGDRHPRPSRSASASESETRAEATRRCVRRCRTRCTGHCVRTHTVHTRSAYYRPALMQQVDRVSIDVLLIGG